MFISFQDAFWTELGPTWSPKGPKMTPTWPPKCPKIGRRRPQEVLEEAFFALENHLEFGCLSGAIWGRFWLPKRGPIGDRDSALGGLDFACYFDVVLDRLQDCPRGAQEAPRPPKSAPRGSEERPRRLQEGLKRPQEPVKRVRDPEDRPNIFQKLQNTRKIAEVNVSHRPCPRSPKEKRRAGGGDPPWGSQSAARPEGRSRACWTELQNLHYVEL